MHTHARTLAHSYTRAAAAAASGQAIRPGSPEADGPEQRLASAAAVTGKESKGQDQGLERSARIPAAVALLHETLAEPVSSPWSRPSSPFLSDLVMFRCLFRACAYTRPQPPFSAGLSGFPAATDKFDTLRFRSCRQLRPAYVVCEIASPRSPRSEVASRTPRRVKTRGQEEGCPGFGLDRFRICRHWTEPLSPQVCQCYINCLEAVELIIRAYHRSSLLLQQVSRPLAPPQCGSGAAGFGAGL